MTHQQLAPKEVTVHPNPHQEGSLIYVLATPPERTSKLAPQWKGPFRVARVQNAYQVIYDDAGIERTVHVNHVKPAKLTAPDIPQVVPPPEPTPPPVGYLPSSLTHEPRAPPAPVVAAPASPAPAAPASQPDSAPPQPVAPCRRSPRLRQTQGHTNTVCPMSMTQV